MFTVQVDSTAGIKVGQWVRLWMPAANNRSRRRLQSADAGQQAARKLRQVTPLPAGKVTVLGTTPAEQAMQKFPRWFDDPVLQAALDAAVKAEWEIAAEIEADPEKVRHAAPAVTWAETQS